MQAVARQALALLIGAIAGYAAFRAGMPLPWMIGPMIANTVAAMLHAPVAAPVRLRPVVIPVIGVMLGSSISSEIFAALAGWAVTVAMMMPFLAAAATMSYLIYRRIGGYDPVTAYYAAMPGGLNDMLLFGIAAGGEEKRIALAHATRILVVIACVGLFYGLVLGVRAGGAGGRPWIALDVLNWQDWLLLAGCAAIGAPLGNALRLPAGNLVGPMVLSGLAHVAHLVSVAPPTLIVNLAQIVLGSVIGCRFLGVTARQIVRDLRLGALSAMSMIAVAVVFAELTAAATGTSPAEVFLAYSPGGLTEMSLLALAMGQDVAYVSVMHLLRILLVILAAPLAFRWIRRA
jgi:membrane AbrB-like protein